MRTNFKFDCVFDTEHSKHSKNNVELSHFNLTNYLLLRTVYFHSETHNNLFSTFEGERKKSAIHCVTFWDCLDFCYQLDLSFSKLKYFISICQLKINNFIVLF